VISQLILIRHGETVQNAAGIAQGWNDSALSELGERQVRAVAQRLHVYGADALYSSPLGRAMFKKLKVYGGAEHPHTAQQPQALDI